MSAVSDAIRYDGFGLTIDADGSFGSPWKYQGALDLSPNATGTATTSLYDFNARNYAPSLGAFTSLDTFAGSAADPLSLNRFLYAEANPATLIDPTGHKVCTGRNDNDCDTLPADPDKANDVKKKWAQEDKHDQDLCARYGECGSSGGSSGGSKPKPSGATPPPKSVPKSVGPGDIPSWAVVQAALGNRAELDRLARLYGPAALRIGQDGNYDPALLASALTLAEWYQYLTAPADYGDATKTVRAQTLLTAEQLEDYSVWASQDDTPDGVVFRAIAVGAVLPTGALGDRPSNETQLETASSAEVLEGERFGPLNQGPLPDEVANTFRSGSYTQTILEDDTTLYRVYGGKAGPAGSFWTRTKPTGSLQAQLDNALNPAWGNTATHTAEVVIPRGTTVYEGVAGPQSLAGGGSLPGGGNQIYIPRVDPQWLVPG